MATPADLYNAHPGDIVVPLSDMLDLLASRLSAAELDELSQTLISRRTTEVAAGDVITAELMNQLLADIGNLQTRIAVLESGIPSIDRPQIILVEPNDGVRIGEQLSVYGQNLSLAQLTSVVIGNRKVNAFSSASNDKLLAFTVPSISGIPEGENGANVSLVVTNEFGSDDYTVKVLRAESTDLVANLILTNEGFPEGVIDAGVTYDFEFKITAATNLTESYTIEAHVEGDSGWTHKLDNGDTSKVITIEKTVQAPEEIVVNSTVKAGTSGSVNVYISIQSDNFPAITKSSPSITLAINETPVGLHGISVLEPVVTIESPDVFADNPSATGALLIRADGAIRFTVEVVMIEQGQCSYSDPVISNNPGGAFTIIAHSPSPSALINAGDSTSLVFDVNVAGQPDTAASKPQISFTVTHSETGEEIQFERYIEISV